MEDKLTDGKCVYSLLFSDLVYQCPAMPAECGVVGGGVLMASALFISAERNNMSLSKFIPE